MRTGQRVTVLVVLQAVLLVGGAIVAHGSSAVDVTVNAKTFDPTSVEIVPGQSVRWTVADLGAHELRAADGSWSSGQLLSGMSYTHTFDQPGTYRYYDALNGRCGEGGCTGMVGQVVVQAPAPPPPVEVEDAEPSPEPSSPQPASPDRNAASDDAASPAPPPPSPPASSPPAPGPEPTPRPDPRPGAAHPLYLETREHPVAAGAPTLVAMRPLVAPPRARQPVTDTTWEPRMTIGPLPPAPPSPAPRLPMWVTVSAIVSLTAGVLWREHVRGRAAVPLRRW